MRSLTFTREFDVDQVQQILNAWDRAQEATAAYNVDNLPTAQMTFEHSLLADMMSALRNELIERITGTGTLVRFFRFSKIRILSESTK